MFRQATCYFRSGSDWEADPVTFRPSVDQVNQIAHFVTVPLGDRTASAIKCRFHFSDQWMLFSEVAFQSGKKWSAVGELMTAASLYIIHCSCLTGLSFRGSQVQLFTTHLAKKDTLQACYQVSSRTSCFSLYAAAVILAKWQLGSGGRILAGWSSQVW